MCDCTYEHVTCVLCLRVVRDQSTWPISIQSEKWSYVANDAWHDDCLAKVRKEMKDYR